MNKLLEIKNLKVSFQGENGRNTALRGVNLSIKKGEIIGIVGESGCGKSVTASSIIKVIPKPSGNIDEGEILFNGKNLLNLTEEEMRKIRGNDIAIIFQDSMAALNPVFTIGEQIGEALKIHKGLKGKELTLEVIRLLKLVNIPRTEVIMNEYPHQLSGGMRQRVMIAMAISCNPKILIADEPTTALDVTVQAQVLDIIKELRRKTNTSVMLITHDLGVIAEMADYVAVMYAGTIVEEGDVETIFDNPKHPYTIALMNSRPGKIKKGEKLKCIPGKVPALGEIIKGCAFSDRCTEKMDICLNQEPSLIKLCDKHKVKCHLMKRG